MGLAIRDQVMAVLGQVPLSTTAIVAKLDPPQAHMPINSPLYARTYAALVGLAEEGRVRRIGGGRRQKHGRKAISWALREGAAR